MNQPKRFILASVALVLGAGLGRANPQSITVQVFENGADPYSGSNTQTLSSITGTYFFSFPDLPDLDFTGISGRVTTNENPGNTNSGFEILRFYGTHNGSLTNTLEIIATDANFVGVAGPYQSTVSISGNGTSASGGIITVAGSVTGTFTGATTSTGAVTGSATGTLSASYASPSMPTGPPTFIGSTTYTLKNDTSMTATADGDFDTVTGSLFAQATPEPSSLLLLGTGLLGVMGAARRKWLG